MVGGNEVVIGVTLGLMCDWCHPGGARGHCSVRIALGLN